MAEKGIRWTPKELAAFESGLAEVHRVYPQVVSLIEEFRSVNHNFRIVRTLPSIEDTGDRWPFFYAFVPAYDGVRQQRLIDNFMKDRLPVASIPVHPLNDVELEQLSNLTSRIAGIGLQVRPSKIFTEDRQIGAMEYKMTPYYKREKGKIVAAYLKPIIPNQT